MRSSGDKPNKPIGKLRGALRDIAECDRIHANPDPVILSLLAESNITLASCLKRCVCGMIRRYFSGTRATYGLLCVVVTTVLSSAYSMYKAVLATIRE